MKRILLILTFALILLTASSSHAKNYKMIFWYPGEQGTTKDAEPILQLFFDYLNSKMKTDTWSGKYFNSPAEGLSYVKNSKPDFGIVSFVALSENKNSIGSFKKIASTLPFPHGTTSDVFTILGHSESGRNSTDNIIVRSSIPISAEFFKSSLAPDLKGNVTIETTNSMLQTLKQISGSENQNHMAILTPMEKHTFDNMTGDWKKNLSTIMKCNPISTAPLIYFGNDHKISDDLIKILTQMPNDSEGKEILETLRLKGFKAEN